MWPWKEKLGKLHFILFDKLLKALSLMGSFSVNSVLYDSDSFLFYLDIDQKQELVQ